MPVLSWAHSHYWQTQTPETPVTPGASARGGYITWMTPTVISGSLFGALQPLYELAVTRWQSRGPRD